MPTPTIQQFGQTVGSQYYHAQVALMAGKGVADNNIYPVSVDPVSGAISIAASSILDFGVTTNTARSAAMIGGYDILPAVKGTGVAAGYTGTLLEKAAADDARALDSAQWLKDHTGKYQPAAGSPGGHFEVAGLVPETWLGLTIAYPSATQETYSFFRDAAKTVALCTVTVDYSDASKIAMTSVVRT
jgi:hypothetical protein